MTKLKRSLIFKLILHFSEIDCKQLFLPSQDASLISSEGTLYMDTVTYQCDGKYSVKLGNLTRTCLADGTWSGNEPVCGEFKVKMIIYSGWNVVKQEL